MSKLIDRAGDLLFWVWLAWFALRCLSKPIGLTVIYWLWFLLNFGVTMIEIMRVTSIAVLAIFFSVSGGAATRQRSYFTASGGSIELGNKKFETVQDAQQAFVADSAKKACEFNLNACVYASGNSFNYTVTCPPFVLDHIVTDVNTYNHYYKRTCVETATFINGSSPWNQTYNHTIYESVCSVGQVFDNFLQKCVGFVDAYAHPPKVCKGGQGNPIYPITGTKRETVSTGVSLAGVPFELTYDTQRAPWGANVDGSPGDASAQGVLGTLWYSSLHPTVTFTEGASINSLSITQPNGAVASFSGSDSTSWTPARGAKDSLTYYQYQYILRNQSNLALEYFDRGSYKARLGPLKATQFASGAFLKTEISTTSSTAAPAGGYVLSLSDQFSRKINFTYKTILSVSPAMVVLDTATLPDGRSIVGNYDLNANLTSLTWQDGNVRQFIYDSPNLGQAWALTGVKDEVGKRYATFSYMPDGWAKSTQYNIESGSVYSFVASYDSAPKPVVNEYPDYQAEVIWRCHEWAAPANAQVMQPNGSNLGLLFFSIPGDVSANGSGKCSSLRFAGYSQPAGSGCDQATSNTSYDNNGNVRFYDDFNGHRTCYAHSTASATSVGNLEITRVEGLPNTATCSGVLTNGVSLPLTNGTQSRKISTQWHPQWAL
ncbi:MAG: hypothetical protein HY019_21180, partial [Aquabacterium sp.]|uniref:hypothetical protein n=1 Tax=Aquabacterium sp. TaxID=1872578 RepID=UPI0025C0C6B5